MNTHLHTIAILSRRTGLTAVLLAVAVGSHAAGTADYYENALLNPSDDVLHEESKGRVTIYDGLESRVVDEALDSQFPRIDHMMFIRTRETRPNGEIMVDDDC